MSRSDDVDGLELAGRAAELDQRARHRAPWVRPARVLVERGDRLARLRAERDQLPMRLADPADRSATQPITALACSSV